MQKRGDNMQTTNTTGNRQMTPRERKLHKFSGSVKREGWSAGKVLRHPILSIRYLASKKEEKPSTLEGGLNLTPEENERARGMIIGAAGKRKKD